jgi:hypothetical protein
VRVPDLVKEGLRLSHNPNRKQRARSPRLAGVNQPRGRGWRALLF